MLEELTVQNYALIDRLSISFRPGFNVLTGETGAGKSILAGALGLIHGSPGDTGSIRTGAEEAIVSATFRVSGNPSALAWLSEHDIAPEDGFVLIRRSVKKTGRGSIYIQSAPVTRGDLETFTALIFDMHGQHEHQSLLDETNHRRILDDYGGLGDVAGRVASRFSELSDLRRRLEALETGERDRLRQVDMLEYAIREIDDARLKAGEEEELEREKTLLSQHEKLYGLLEGAYEALGESRNGALAYLRKARGMLSSASDIDQVLGPQSNRLDDLFYELEDVAETVRDRLGSLTFSPGRLDEVADRLAFIHRLEKKYGSSIPEILSYRDEAAGTLEGLENAEANKEALTRGIKQVEAALREDATELSRRRSATAKDLEERITAILRTLGMAKTGFEIAVEKRRNASGAVVFTSAGFDDVYFRLTPNVGEPPKPLRRIASGGEISRVMLAIKTVLAQTDPIGTLVFDEIDTGIGGEVALAVGSHLAELARHKQVLCITHLASIAARADVHVRVEKRESAGRTITRVESVEGEGRVEEIARMLAGDREGSTSRTHARELLERLARPVSPVHDKARGPSV